MLLRRLKIKKSNILSWLLLSLLLLAFFNQSAFAVSTSLYLSPATAKFDIGDSLALAVYVNSDEQAINAVSGVISFPADKLEVNSLSKSGSIINLWVLEPFFSNSTGRVSFEGLILNPGFVGTGGKVITVNFKVKSAGTAYLSLSSASVLANDGLGTNILTGLGSASYELGSTGQSVQLPEVGTQSEIRPEASGESQPVVADRAPYAPIVISETHPDQNVWYQEIFLNSAGCFLPERPEQGFWSVSFPMPLRASATSQPSVPGSLMN